MWVNHVLNGVFRIDAAPLCGHHSGIQSIILKIRVGPQGCKPDAMTVLSACLCSLQPPL